MKQVVGRIARLGTWLCAPLWLSAILASPAGAQHASLQALFEAGNRAYFEGDYAAASDHYEELVTLGVHDPDVYYNLATSQAKRGRYGVAIWAFERALYLRAGDEDSLRGLRQARAALSHRTQATPSPQGSDVPWLGGLLRSHAASTLAIWLLLSNMWLFGSLLALPRLRRENARVALGIGAVLAAGLGVASALALAAKLDWFQEGQPAVVLGDAAPLREGPDLGANIRGTAREAQRGRILRGQHGYWRVRLSDGQQGWMHHDDIAPIEPVQRTSAQR